MLKFLLILAVLFSPVTTLADGDNLCRLVIHIKLQTGKKRLLIEESNAIKQIEFVPARRKGAF